MERTTAKDRREHPDEYLLLSIPSISIVVRRVRLDPRLAWLAAIFLAGATVAMTSLAF